MNRTIAPSVPGNIAIPEPVRLGGTSSLEQLERAARVVAEHKGSWSRVDLESRIEILDRILAGIDREAGRWVEAECRAKSLPVAGRAAGQEWFLGPAFVARGVRLLRDTLRNLQQRGRPGFGPLGITGAGQRTVRVYPTSIYDQLYLPGHRTDVWLSPQIAPGKAEGHAAGAYRSSTGGAVCLVLGAGNISALQPLDVLHQSFAENRVVVLKCSPVQAHMIPILEEVFRPLVESCYLRIVVGGAEEARTLAHDPLVDVLHMTGSDKTYEAIVYGTGEDGARRKAEHRPMLTKPFTAELGSVTPVIVVPGPWSPRDLSFHGEGISSCMVMNGSLLCVATRLVVTHRGWSGREALVAAMRAAMDATPPPVAYYPGTTDRHSRFLDAYPDAERLGRCQEGSLPWLFASGLSEKDGEFAFTTDPFCGTLSEVCLDADSVPDFIDRAVDLLEERVWGNLAAGIIIHPRSLHDPMVARTFKRAIERLHYGSVAINTSGAVGFVLVSPPWGAYPGNERSDIRSGNGFVHNTYLLDAPQKSVTYAPFRQRPKPAWFTSHRSMHEVMRRVAGFQVDPSPGKIPALFRWALRG